MVTKRSSLKSKIKIIIEKHQRLLYSETSYVKCLLLQNFIFQLSFKINLQKNHFRTQYSTVILQKLPFDCSIQIFKCFKMKKLFFCTIQQFSERYSNLQFAHSKSPYVRYAAFKLMTAMCVCVCLCPHKCA